MSREIPILFNSDMVRAILSGQKTQTRRPVRIQPHGAGAWVKRGDEWVFPNVNPLYSARCPFGQPGDLLWVRETFALLGNDDCCPIDWEGTTRDETRAALIYRASCWREPGQYGLWSIPGRDTLYEGWWRPSIHMPRWASRILLRVTDVRLERVQDIDDAGAIAEGVGHGHYIYDGWRWRDWRLSAAEAAVSPMLESARASYGSLWESICGNWRENPWVWVTEFERVTDSKREAA